MRKEETIINVIFDAKRGEVSVESREAVCGQPFGTLPKPTRAGYTFEGWYLDGTLVTDETIVASEEDICLVARWAKKAGGAKKPSVYRKQRLAAAVLAVLTVVLIVALVFVNHIVEIYGLTDVYYGDDGEVYTEKYYVRKKQGSYGLYDRDGTLMEKNSEGYYIAKSGNQYEVDAETGEYSLYAVVDYDQAGGEVLGFSDRIMLFPQISQSYVLSIKVENSYGGFEFYKNDEGKAVLKGTEDTITVYDPELYASLCVSCGFPLSMQKLDFSENNPEVPRLPDGSVNYAEYGLVDVTDGSGNVTYTPAVYTITGYHLYDVDGDGEIRTKKDGKGKVDMLASEHVTATYRVMVGDKLISGGGYYIKMDGGKLVADGFEKEIASREAVYIVSNTISETVLQPVESLVTPIISYPTSLVTHAMVSDFMLGRVNIADLPKTDEEWEALDIKPIAAFTYQDLAERENTMYTSLPYISLMEDLLHGYDIKGDSASAVLSLFYQMKFVRCVELGLSAEALDEYGLSGDVYFITYGSPVTGEKNVIEGYVTNTLLVSDKTENNTYYVASLLSNMIVEVDQYYFSFLEWEQKQWYEQYFFGHNVAHIQKLNIQIGKEKFQFTLDNSETEQTDKISSTKLKVYCDRFTGGQAAPNLLDYKITYSYKTDSGTEKTKQITGLDNFLAVYTKLIWFSLMGDVDAADFKAQTGMTMAEYVAANPDSTCGESQNNRGLQAIIYYKAEDLASELNNFTYKDKDGNEVKLYTENNKKDIVLRFYTYSDWKTYLTLEVVESFDENGNPITNPANASGAFWVDTTYLQEMLTDINELLAGKIVDDEIAALDGLKYH